MAKGWFRGSERRAMQLPARLKGLEPEVSPAALVNLGLNGAAIATAIPLTVGREFELELQPPNLWDPLCIRVRSVWCEFQRGAYVTGLHFEHEGSAAVGLLADLMSAGKYD